MWIVPIFYWAGRIKYEVKLKPDYLGSSLCYLKVGIIAYFNFLFVIFFWFCFKFIPSILVLFFKKKGLGGNV